MKEYNWLIKPDNWIKLKVSELNWFELKLEKSHALWKCIVNAKCCMILLKAAEEAKTKL